MKPWIIALLILVSTTIAFAAPPATTTFNGVSLLRGTYAITSHQADYESWSALVSCPNYSGWIYAGSDVGNEATDGTITFDGKGGATYSITEYGRFDYDLSNQTATWACDNNGNPYITNSGHAVYDPPKSQNGTGTYTVQSDYTGRMDVGDPSSSLYFRLSGVNWIGPATSFTFHSVKSDNSGGDVGTGIIQNCSRFCVP